MEDIKKETQATRRRGTPIIVESRSLNRRDFVRMGGAAAATALWLGCFDSAGGKVDSGFSARDARGRIDGAGPADASVSDGSLSDSRGSDTSRADGGADLGKGDGRSADGLNPDSAGADARNPTCGTITEANIEGPFFRPSSPERSSLLEANTPGVRLHIKGKVYGPGCTPLAGALLDFWQANDSGAYDNVGFTFRGHQFTKGDGSYALETIIPGHYLNGATYRPAHIHVKAGGIGTSVLTTQLYFSGDRYNAGDPWILDSLIMGLKDSAGGQKLAIFDFVLPKA